MSCLVCDVCCGFFFFFQAEDGIRDLTVTGVQTCALPIFSPRVTFEHGIWLTPGDIELIAEHGVSLAHNPVSNMKLGSGICPVPALLREIGRASCRERV